MTDTLRKVGPQRLRLTQRMMNDYLVLVANFELVSLRMEEEREKLITLLQQKELEQEIGPMEAVLDSRESRRPAWKQELIKLVGKEKAEEIQIATAPSISLKPVIRKRATITV